MKGKRMKYLFKSRMCTIMLAILLAGGMTMEAEAVEEAAYAIVQAEDRFELRDYEPHIVAEIRVEGTREEAGNRAFNRLYRYIAGDNQPRQAMAMTAPVTQQRAGEKIAMTAPVGQRAVGDQWAVSFMMPASYTLETLPVPDQPDISLRENPGQRMAAVRYSGRWTERNYLRHEAELNEWIAEQGWQIVGDPVWARYNAPFVPWFMRRNEILIPVWASDSGL